MWREREREREREKDLLEIRRRFFYYGYTELLSVHIVVKLIENLRLLGTQNIKGMKKACMIL